MPPPPATSVLDRIAGDERIRCAVELACSSDPTRTAEVWHQLVGLVGSGAGATAWLADGATRRLLPLIGAAVDAISDHDELARAAADATAESWGLNQRVLAAAADAVAVLGAAGIGCLAFKGLGLLGDAYPQQQLRPLGDADLLVRPEHADRAVDALLAAGWRGERPVRLALLAATALPFEHATGATVDLHWWASSDLPRGGPSGPSAWGRAAPVPAAHPLHGSGLVVAAPADHLVVLAAHAAHPSRQLGVHTVVDAHRLLLVHGRTGSGALEPAAVWAAADADAAALRVQRLLEAVGQLSDLDVGALLRPLAGRAVAAEQRAIDAGRRAAALPPGRRPAFADRRDRILAATPGMHPVDRLRVGADLAASWSSGRFRHRGT